MRQLDTVNQLPDCARHLNPKFDGVEKLFVFFCKTFQHPLFGTYSLQMRLKESPSTCFEMKCHTHLLKYQK